jgi:hypothetical protein
VFVAAGSTLMIRVLSRAYQRWFPVVNRCAMQGPCLKVSGRVRYRDLNVETAVQLALQS